VIVAGVLWAALVLIWAFFIHGGNVYMCLGGFDMTEAKCRAANGMPALTEWDLFMRGWGLVAILLLAGWAVMAVVATRRRQRGGL
jgi:hypothetical protein